MDESGSRGDAGVKGCLKGLLVVWVVDESWRWLWGDSGGGAAVMVGGWVRAREGGICGVAARRRDDMADGVARKLVLAAKLTPPGDDEEEDDDDEDDDGEADWESLWEREGTTLPRTALEGEEVGERVVVVGMATGGDPYSMMSA